MIASESIGVTRHYLSEGLPPKKIKYVDDSRLHLLPFRSYVEMCRYLQQAFAQHVNAKTTVVVHPAYLSQTGSVGSSQSAPFVGLGH
jgi:hypothetical protein